jgi:hypothetical protein
VNVRVRRARFFDKHVLHQHSTGNIISVITTCIAHEVNQSTYLHKIVHGIVHGWPQDKLHDPLPDRVLAAHSELYALPMPSSPRALSLESSPAARGPTRSGSFKGTLPAGITSGRGYRSSRLCLCASIRRLGYFGASVAGGLSA